MLENPILRFLTVFVCSMLFVLCDFLAAKWGKQQSMISLYVLIPLAPFSYILFGYLNQKYPLAVVSAWVVLWICLSTVLLGIFYFGDELTGRQSAGLVMAVFAMVLFLS